MIKRSQTVDVHLAPLRPWLEDPEVTELGVNRPGELWCERGGRWEPHAIKALTVPHLKALSVAVAKFVYTEVTDSKPILSGTLPDGERIQIIMPPACEPRTVSMTIRKPSITRLTMDDFDRQGYFDHVEPVGQKALRNTSELESLLEQGLHREFLQRAVEVGKAIVVAGKTGSSKTTLMKALTEYIPPNERLVTIEDVSELHLPEHDNHVHLFYPSEADDESPVTATKLLKACMRMKPDRIVLAECRGAETYDFISSSMSGHGGSITSVHAGSCALAFERMAVMMLQNRQGRALGGERVMSLIKQVVDVVVHVDRDFEHGYHVTEVLFNKGAEQ